MEREPPRQARECPAGSPGPQQGLALLRFLLPTREKLWVAVQSRAGGMGNGLRSGVLGELGGGHARVRGAGGGRMCVLGSRAQGAGGQSLGC